MVKQPVKDLMAKMLMSFVSIIQNIKRLAQQECCSLIILIMNLGKERLSVRNKYEL